MGRHSPLLSEVACFTNLTAAWQRVRSRGGCAGIDGVTLARFERHWRHRVARLREQLLAKTYWPLPNRRLFIPKGRFSLRPLAVPSVRDRVVQAAVLEAVGPALNEQLHDSCYAYRPGRSIFQAIDRIEALHWQGLEWVVETDIRNCFDSLDHDLLMKRWRESLGGSELDWLIERWLCVGVGDMGRWHRPERGVPQGGVISPLLCNLYLHPFDCEMARRGHSLIRYADDLVALCQTREHAASALRTAASLISRLHLELASEKTRICSFSDGFRFLGARFRGRDVERPHTGTRYGWHEARHERALGGSRGADAADPQWQPMPLDPPPEYLAISSIVSYCFCPLSFYYRQVLGEEPRSPALEVGRARHRMRGWQGSADTAALYDIPLVSERLRLMGRADAVEMRWNVVYPVEFKATRTRALRPGFRQQLCAQGMALEEMTEAPVAFGYVEFLPSGQRELVMLDAALRAETETTVAAMHRLVASGEKPPGRSRPRCGPCSMRPVCLPEDLEAASQALSLEA